MNSWLKIVSICTVSWLSMQSMASPTGGYDHGNGGDYIRELFNQSRNSIATKVSQLKSCSFQGLDLDASEWILKNQARYAEDLLQSPHYWTVDSQPTCAFTAPTSKQGIYFSYPTCLNSSNSEEKAMFIFAHESAHHLGISDETFADRVARTIMSSTVKDFCPTERSPFDPNFCDGNGITQQEVLRFFTGGQSTSNFVAHSYFRRRVRNCNRVNGCSEFKETPVTYIIPKPDGVPDETVMVEKMFDSKDDFRFKISFDSVELVLPASLHRFASKCGGSVLSKPVCTITSSASPSSYYEKRSRTDSFNGKVTNRCFKLIETHNSKPSSQDGSYSNVETVWYSEY